MSKTADANTNEDGSDTHPGIPTLYLNPEYG